MISPMLRNGRPDFVVHYNYRYIILKNALDMLSGGAVNLHISLLPWNRGPYPNLWRFLDDTPKGMTIHLIDEGVDTGKILFQKEVFFDENKETLVSFHENLHDIVQWLFKENWYNIKHGTIKPIPQSCGGNSHTIEDFSKHKPITKKIKVIIKSNGS